MSFLSPKSSKSPNTSPRNSDAGGTKKSFFSSSSSSTPTAAEQERASHYPPIGAGQLSIHIASADSLHNPRMIGHIDPYIQITIGNKQAKSDALNNTSAPTWNFDQLFDLDGTETMAIFEVFHKGFVANSVIGRQEIPLVDLIQPPDQKSFRLFRGHDMADQAGVIHMTLRWLPSSSSGLGLGAAPSVVQSSYREVSSSVVDSEVAKPVGTGAAVASVAALPVTVDSSVQRSSSFHSDAKAPLTASSSHSGVYESAFTQPVSQISAASVSPASGHLPLTEVGPAPATVIAETATVSTLPVGQIIHVPTTIATIPAELTQPLPTFTSPPWKQTSESASSSSATVHATERQHSGYSATSSFAERQQSSHSTTVPTAARQLSQSSSSGYGAAHTENDRYYMAKGEGALASSGSKHSLSSGSDDALTTTETRSEFQRASSSSEMV